MTPEAIRLCAELSQAAYLSPGDIRAWLQEKGFEEPHFLDASANPRGFLATRDGDATYVSFRGTERNFRDIFADVDACLVPAGGNGFLAHKGFWDSLGELYGV